MTVILHEQDEIEVVPRAVKGDGLWLEAADVSRATGFELKPEGLCRGAVCVPVPKGGASFVDGGAVDIAAFWNHLGNPVVHDAARRVWALGVGAQARVQALETLQAPDLTLADIAGRRHALADYRGRKVFLATWASW